MARIEDMSDIERKHIEHLNCPVYDTQSWVDGPPLHKRRVAIISTAGVHPKGDRPFTFDPGDCYRVIPGDIKSQDLVMTHVSTNFDHTGFQQDWNVIFPVDRLRELAAQDVIGSVADFHYAFMGANDPMTMEEDTRRPWYDMAVQKKGRTTVGVSGLEMDVIVDFLCSFLGDEWPESPRDDLSLPYTLNLATDDLKAYYFEGITSNGEAVQYKADRASMKSQ